MCQHGKLSLIFPLTSDNLKSFQLHLAEINEDKTFAQTLCLIFESLYSLHNQMTIFFPLQPVNCTQPMVLCTAFLAMHQHFDSRRVRHASRTRECARTHTDAPFPLRLAAFHEHTTPQGYAPSFSAVRTSHFFTVTSQCPTLKRPAGAPIKQKVLEQKTPALAFPCCL